MAVDVEANLRELKATDEKLSELYRDNHPRRVALREQITELENAQSGVLMNSGYFLPKELTLDLGGGVSMKLVLIPAGRFIMGSPNNEKYCSNEHPQREVTVTKPFYMSIHEVTQAQYQAVIGNNPSYFKGENNPVEKVSWNDAKEFCKRLSQRTGKTVRLPTEAQWEYACRAGSKNRFSFGDKDEDLCKYGNYCDKSNTNNWPWQDKVHSDGFDKTAPVGSFPSNAFGLYDMHGNVWEWCEDWRANSYANAKNVDPAGPASGLERVQRGGSWDGGPASCRSAIRNGNSPDSQCGFDGFRVAVDLPAGQASLK